MFLRRLNLEENYKYNVLWIKSQIKYLRFQLKVLNTVYFIRQKIFGQKLFPSNQTQTDPFRGEGSRFPSEFCIA